MISPISRVMLRQMSCGRTAMCAGRNLRTGVQSGRIPSSILSRSIVTKKYSQEHEWVELDSDTGIATVSITRKAANDLGDVVFVELPQSGSEYAQGDSMGTIESVKAAADVYAPISGTIEAINTALSDTPSLLNEDPEGEGWLCKIKAATPAELDTLMDEKAYTAFCEADKE